MFSEGPGTSSKPLGKVAEGKGSLDVTRRLLRWAVSFSALLYFFQRDQLDQLCRGGMRRQMVTGLE